MKDLRVGIGLDAHAFSDDAALVLGGVDFPGDRGLAGHSDGDVVAHALIDAVLGAAGLGDIGELFPSGDPQWLDASSIRLLQRAYEVVRGAGPWESTSIASPCARRRPTSSASRAAAKAWPPRRWRSYGAPEVVRGQQHD